MDEYGNDWRRQLLLGLGVLVIVAVVIGGIVAVIALKAASDAGLTSGPTHSPPGGRPPASAPTGTASTTPATALPSTVLRSPSKKPPTSSTKPKPKPVEAISFSAKPTVAKVYQRVQLTGHYRGQQAATLLIQQNTGTGWSNFPVSIHVRNGAFTTWIASGRSGPNRFRLMDAANHEVSNVVIINIH